MQHSTSTRGTLHTPCHEAHDNPASCETSPLLSVERARDVGRWRPRRWADLLNPKGLYDRLFRAVRAASRTGESNRRPGRGDAALCRIPTSGEVDRGFDLDS